MSVSSNAEALDNTEYPFIAVTPESTLTGVTTRDRTQSMGQIEQTIYANKGLMLNIDFYQAIIETYKLSTKRGQRFI